MNISPFPNHEQALDIPPPYITGEDRNEVERLCDTGHSLVAYIGDSLIDLKSFTPDWEASKDGVPLPNKYRLDNLLDEYGVLRDKLQSDRARHTSPSANEQRIQANIILDLSRRLFGSPDGSSNVRLGYALAKIGYMAALAKPAPQSSPIKHQPESNEPGQLEVFGAAMNALQFKAHPRHSSLPRITAAYRDENPTASEHSPLTIDNYSPHEAIQLFAGGLLRRVLSPSTTAEGAQRDSRSWDHFLRLREAAIENEGYNKHRIAPLATRIERSPTFEPPQVEGVNLEFITVTKELLRAEEHTGQDHVPSQPDTSATRGDGDHKKERMSESELTSWLGSLAMEWQGTDTAQLVRVDLSGQQKPKKRPYMAALLPETLPDGTAVTHVVADSGEIGDGIFAYRADRPKKGEAPTLPWEELFDDTKRGAKSRGVRMIAHVPASGDPQVDRQHDKERVMDYLTRPQDEIDNPIPL